VNITPPLSDLLTRWLNDATRGLPANIAEIVRGELQNHYLDACETHAREGLPPDEAARLALAELGDAAEVDAGLRSAHISRARLVAAMLACALYPLSLALMPRMEAILGNYFALMIQDVVSVLVLVYVISTFIQLLGFDKARLRMPAGLLIAGIVINVFDRLIFFALFHQLPLIGPGDSVYWNTASGLSILMDCIFLGSELLTALATLWLGLRLLRLPERLFGLQRPTALLMLATTPVDLAVMGALLFKSMLLAGLFSVTGYAVITILLALLILIFFRAAFRPTAVPLKTA
jgi:hypothetical protein